jgi:rhodanese-related sulfurtransferase
MRFGHEHLTTLYWTLCARLRTVWLMIKLFALFLPAFFAVHAHAGAASAVSADDAHAAIAQGAYVLDVRTHAQYAAGHLPQAIGLPEQTAALPLRELAAMLTQAGVDSSRTMLVVGDAGDVNAQALWLRLAQVTSGRVLWLVGGVQEWQMRGHILTTEVSVRQPVPQVLASFSTPEGVSRMAGGKVRTSALLERNIAVQMALN